MSSGNITGKGVWDEQTYLENCRCSGAGSLSTASGTALTGTVTCVPAGSTGTVFTTSADQTETCSRTATRRTATMSTATVSGYTDPENEIRRT